MIGLPSALELRIIPEPNSGCWLWLGALSRGYGRTTIYHSQFHEHYAHRVIYRLLIGSIPDGLTLDHKCRVRHCVNPAHLEPVPIGVNVLRGESASGVNSRRTSCVHGHELSGENLYEYKGHRFCRACNRRNALRWYHRQDAAFRLRAAKLRRR